MKKLLLLIFALSFSHQIIACEFEDVTFDSDFSVARLDGCEKISDDRYRLTIESENYPINNSSPWYAFKVSSKKPSKIRVEMIFKKDKPRYHPKVSRDGHSWSGIRFKVKKNRLTYLLEVDEKPLWVAGQEIINNQFYVSWLNSIKKLGNHQLSVLGNSTQERPIYQLESNTKSNEWVVLMGRMHPPEVTGALALFPFSQEILLGEGISQKFRERFNILLIPNLNPDGVEHGHWRNNINGIDLNRDWNKFKQKETQIVHNKLQQITKDGGKIVYAIDFHSTRKDIFYTMPADYGLHPANLTNDWLATLEKNMPDFTVRTKPGNNPDNGVFKQYIADNYGVHAITYEMGDHTDRKIINDVAKSAANAFMQHMLDTPKSDFIK